MKLYLELSSGLNTWIFFAQEMALQIQRDEEKKMRYLEHKRQQRIARDEEEHKRLQRIMKELEEAELGMLLKLL